MREVPPLATDAEEKVGEVASLWIPSAKAISLAERLLFQIANADNSPLKKSSALQLLSPIKVLALEVW